ncbi:BTAD domain-containing putative transcriptional regulator [Saccharomonospora sp. CUA-673]|uniref:AfsR/SARP family transcriptional regulator n=1 Tax=Saccharomonospora sp. CUA-673 TaxID=1904969 RepID=UPI0011154301|nr:BTAD domain-containing putative transcriptional regulator [Saccharomonospora sp. CUA-673]
MTSIEIDMLGELDVRVAGTPVPIPRGKQQLLLAALALRPGRFMSTEDLIDRVWGEDPPETARTTLRGYIKRLRSALAGAREPVIEAASGGYRLLVGQEGTDLGRFRCRRRAAADSGGPAELCGLQGALELWRGRSLDGLDRMAWVEQEAEVLDEEYLQVCERVADLLLELGDAERAVSRLRPLVRTHPYRECLWARLLLALHHAGRTADALVTYDEVRRMLADRLGVAPSAHLRGVHERLLREDAHAAAVAPPRRPSVPRPRGTEETPQGDLVGRARLLDLLGRTVDAGRSRLVVVDGPAGVGKTALVDHWAAGAASGFPGGVLRVDLRGFHVDPPLSVAEGLTDLLVQTGAEPTDLPVGDPAALAALLRSRTARRRALIVLDNARDAAQVRPLLPGTASVAVVTSQNQLRGLVAGEGAVRVTVPPLSARDGVELLCRHAAVETDGLDNREALYELVDLCDGLPLALRIAAEELGRVPGAHAGGLVAQLRAERSRLDQLDTGDEATGVRAVLSRAYAHLTPAEGELLRLLAAGGKLEFDVDDVGRLTERDRAGARAAMRGLLAVNVVAERAPDHYRLGDLQRLAAGGEAAVR